MRPEVPAMGLGALPGLFAAAAADMVERGRIRARASGSASTSPARGVKMGRRRSARLALGAIAVAVVGWVIAGPPGAIFGAVAVLALPVALSRRARTRRAQRMERQLTEAVSVISSGLRAGQSLIQAVSLAGEEIAAPLGPTIRDMADRVALGAPFDRTIRQWTAQVGVPEARLVAAVLGLQRRTGGDLAVVLDRLGRTLRDRSASATEVRSLTAQARLSGAILGFLPIGFFLFLAATARQDISAAYRSSLGASAIAAGLLMEGAAFLWIRRLLVVEP
jgi:tight adherence protein B